MENKSLNEKESLELIARMIQNTHNNLENRGYISLLVNGYCTLFISLLVYFLVRYTHNNYYFLLWFGIILIGGLWEYFEKRNHPKRVTTFIDRVVGYIWIVLGIMIWITAGIAFFEPIPVLLLIALFANAGTAMTGLIIKFKALTIGGFIGIGLSFSLIFITSLECILIFAAIFLFCMIIPGHILQQAEKKNRIKSERYV